MRHWDDGSGVGWAWMLLMMLVFWTFVVGAVVLLVRLLKGEDNRPDSARRLLDERFARGEIDAEEYRTRRELLGSRR